MNQTISGGAIVAQGGGMRSVFGAGVLSRLGDEYRSLPAYAVSSGAINVAYYLCNQIEDLRRLYFDLVPSRNVINPRRFWRVIDLRRLRAVLEEDAPLALPRGGLQLTVPLVHRQTGRLVYKSMHGLPVKEVYDVLMAAASIPILYGRTWPVGSQTYGDGTVADALPLGRAIGDGFRTGLVVMTRPLEYRRVREPIVKRTVKKVLATGSGWHIASRMGETDPLYNETVAQLQNGVFPGYRVIAPSIHRGNARTDTEAGRLATLWADGERAAQ